MNEARRESADQPLRTRRDLLRLAAASSASLAWASENPWASAEEQPSKLSEPDLRNAVNQLDAYFTLQERFQDVSRGNPLPHSLPDDKKRAVGLTRETWRLEVISDPDHPVKLRRPLAAADGTAINFDALMQLAEKHAVRFAKVMTCLNIGSPLGMGLWEGVPLREVLWLTQPREDLRRVFYYGYHNDDPKQMFRSSLPVGRVLEDPYDLPPVILCYKLNGHWLDSQRGGPVRMVVPEGYGFKSIKWLSHVVLSNLYHANDTYADGNNDVDSPLKTFAATLSVPGKVQSGQRIALTGYAQVGISGLSKVQVSIAPKDHAWPADDRYYSTANWIDAEILPPPERWGGDLSDGKIPEGTLGFDSATGQPQPKTWPMRLCKVYWAALLAGQPAGRYELRSRTIDEKGIAQPMPRPFRKSGHSAIETVDLLVE